MVLFTVTVSKDFNGSRLEQTIHVKVTEAMVTKCVANIKFYIIPQTLMNVLKALVIVCNCATTLMDHISVTVEMVTL